MSKETISEVTKIANRTQLPIEVYEMLLNDGYVSEPLQAMMRVIEYWPTSIEAMQIAIGDGYLRDRWEALLKETLRDEVSSSSSNGYLRLATVRHTH